MPMARSRSGFLASSAAVAIDDPSLVLVAIAGPVGLAVYYGWSDRRRARRARVTGFAAALAGAVIGTWLGYAAAEDFAALLTGVLGAVAGANLALVARDVAGGEDAPAPPAPAPVAEPVVQDTRVLV